MGDIKATLGDSIGKLLGKNTAPKEEKKTPTPKQEKNPLTNDAETYLKIIAKNFMSIHLMARDLNVARQNVVKLVKLEGGDAVNKADAWFLKEGERETKLEVEAGKGKEKTPEPVAKPKKKKSFMESIMEQFKFDKIIKSFTKYFYLIGAIALIWDLFKESFTEWVDGLWESIKETFDEWVGKLKEWFNEFVQPIIDKVMEFIQPVIDAVKSVIDSIGKWFTEKIDWFAQTFPETFAFIKKIIDKVKEVINYLQEKLAAAWDAMKKVGKGVKEFFFGKEKPKEEKKLPQVKLDKNGNFIDVPPSEVPPVGVPTGGVKGAPTPAATGPSPAISKEEQARVSATEVKPTPAKGEEKPYKPSGKPAPSPGFEAGKKQMLAAMDAEGIKNPDQRAQVIAQTAHESGKYKYTEELGKPAYFEKYEGRKDLGNTQPGDGPRFKGRGFLQTTGRVNYQQFKDAFGVDVISEPEKLAEPENAAKSAMFWFHKNAKKVEKLSGGDWSNTKGVTKAVNGGYNGLAEREHFFEMFRNDPEITKVAAGGTAPSGTQVASNSSDVASGQRQQQKPTTPVVVNAPTTNNNTTVTNKVASKAPTTDTGSSVAARAA